MYGVADLHADVISKLLENPGWIWSDSEKSLARFDATPERLKTGGIILQVFPLYVADSLPHTPETLFRGAELFHSQINAHPDIKLALRSSDLSQAEREGKIAAVFSLEGADSLQGSLWALRLLFRLGLRLLGPTWNHANWACDGAMEPRGGGFTRAGKQLVEECRQLGIIIDVSHLSDKGFWELAEAGDSKLFASHSNAREIRNHPRNLTDEQIRALIVADGLIGLTFVPWFATDKEKATVDDLLRHVEHVCELGGALHIAFGSDFDGIDRHIVGLENPACYPGFAEALLRRYPEELVRGMLGRNAIRFLEKNLPK
ncbi:dipeptidase [Cohnella faecalis]|uniref:dipeptidase n=1 Tax=Cohnella faecalis TaxID=2315694 RepID=UPI0036061A6E